jgi:hypothetical protein
MRRILIRSAVLVGALLGLLSLWIFAGRSFSLFLDRFVTSHVESRSIDQVAYEGNESGGMFEIAGSPFSTAGRDLKPFPLTFQQDSEHQFVISLGGKLFSLGPISSEGNRFQFTPQTGDKVSFSIRRSLLSWPTPFDFNFMSGHSPSWRRNLYYVLAWRKADGQQLEMIWRYEQYFYPGDGWASGFMTREGATGLIRVKISP